MNLKIPENYIPMKQKDIKELRYKLWLLNDKKCPILNKEIPFENTALDHAHKTKSEPFSPTKGVIRGSISMGANVVLGKIENSIKRTGLTKDEDFNLPDFLRNLADFLENCPYVEDDCYYIHPNEVPKEPNVSKSNYNKLKKLYNESNQRKKFPEYPKSKKLTKPLEALFEEFGISPYN